MRKKKERPVGLRALSSSNYMRDSNDRGSDARGGTDLSRETQGRTVPRVDGGETGRGASLPPAAPAAGTVPLLPPLGAVAGGARPPPPAAQLGGGCEPSPCLFAGLRFSDLAKVPAPPRNVFSLNVDGRRMLVKQVAFFAGPESDEFQRRVIEAGSKLPPELCSGSGQVNDEWDRLVIALCEQAGLTEHLVVLRDPILGPMVRTILRAEERRRAYVKAYEFPVAKFQRWIDGGADGEGAGTDDDDEPDDIRADIGFYLGARFEELLPLWKQRVAMDRLNTTEKDKAQ